MSSTSGVPHRIPPGTPAAVVDCLPPHAHESEQMLAGTAVRYPELAEELFAALDADEFYFHAHRFVWETLARLAARGEVWDGAVVWEELRRTGRGDDVGAAYLATLIEAAGAGATWEYHAGVVREKAAQRALLAAANAAIRDIEEPGASALDIAARLSTAVERSLGDDRRAPVRTAADAIRSGLADIEERHRPDRSRLRLGWDTLDHLIPSLDPGQLIVVGGRPAAGKTAFALGLAANAAEDRAPVLFVSLEMSESEVGQRLAFRLTGLNGHSFRSGRTSADDRRRLADTVEFNGVDRLAVADAPVQRVRDIAAQARRTRRAFRGLGLVVVDYLQLVTPDNRRDDRRQQVEQVSRDLKRLAKEMRVPVVALAQLNREVEARQDGKPRLSDLREAGGIEQDADVVLLLYRHADHPEDAPTVPVGVVVAKHRNGPTGEATLDYRRACMRFENRHPY